MPRLGSIVVLLVALSLSASAEHPHEEVPNFREGKIFNQQFWDGFEKGMDDTFGVITRVRDNLEVAMDQITDNLETNINSFADRIDDRVEESLPPFLRRVNRPGMDQTFEVSGISGNIGDDVDDGLEVYYSKSNEEGEDQNLEDSEVDISLLPEGETIKKVVDEEQEEQPLRPQRNPFNFFNSPFFRPFAPSNRDGIINIFRPRSQWWQGENVCIDREEIDEAEKNTNDQIEAAAEVEISTDPTTTPKPQQNFPFTFRMDVSSCTETRDTYTCTTRTSKRGINKTVKVSYRCCHGFARSTGTCDQIELKSMSETLDSLVDTTDFLSLAKAANLVKEMESPNRTLFVPTNEAIEEYTLELEAQNELENIIGEESNSIFRRKRQVHNLTPTLLAHMTYDFLYLGDLVDEMVIDSLNPESSIRINVYDRLNPPVVTINCAKLVTANQHSTTGVIHTIDRVLTPVQKSIFEIVQNDPQFSILKKLIEMSELNEVLNDASQHYTLFAPTDEAFGQLKPATLESLLEGSSCLDAVIKMIILPNTICSTAIQGKKKTVNELEEYLVVERDEADVLKVEDATIVETDIVASNGVVHSINKVLMPNEAKSVEEVLEAYNLTKFIELVVAANLMEEINAQKDITVFAPSNNAINSLPKDHLDGLKADTEALRELIRFHITTPSIKARNINNNHMAETKAGRPLRINIYSTRPLFTDIFGGIGERRAAKLTAGCSTISNLDSRACGAVVHVLENMLEVPKANVVESLAADPEFSLFHQMVKDTGIDEELTKEGPFTVLVPSDHALRTLPENELQEILNDNELKEKIVRRHIMIEHVCCTGISSSSFMNARKRTLDGSSLHLRRNYAGRLMAGSARIIQCGSPSDNGVVHTVNRVLVEDREMPTHQRRTPGVRIFNLPRIMDILDF